MPARSRRTRSGAPIPSRPPTGPTISTICASRTIRSARSSRSWPKACPPASARRFTPSSIQIWPAAMMSINAVKGVEIGEGMAAAALTGVDNADEIRMGPNGPEYLSNHAGGILGGISTGQPVVVRFAVKPTSSILTPRRTINARGRGDRPGHQGPPRPLRRHPRRAGGRGDDGLRPAGPSADGPGPDRRRARPDRLTRRGCQRSDAARGCPQSRGFGVPGLFCHRRGQGDTGGQQAKITLGHLGLPGLGTKELGHSARAECQRSGRACETTLA